MDTDAFLDKLSSEAFERLNRVESDPLRLSEPWRTIVLIYSAQGIIDNGGFRYFFENDWPNNTPYEQFAMAYDRIGKTNAASAIRSAVTAMRIEDAEHKIEERRAYIENNAIGDREQIAGWDDDIIIGDEAVMASLAKWIRTQSKP